MCELRSMLVSCGEAGGQNSSTSLSTSTGYLCCPGVPSACGSSQSKPKMVEVSEFEVSLSGVSLFSSIFLILIFPFLSFFFCSWLFHIYIYIYIYFFFFYFYYYFFKFIYLFFILSTLFWFCLSLALKKVEANV